MAENEQSGDPQAEPVELSKEAKERQDMYRRAEADDPAVAEQLLAHDQQEAHAIKAGAQKTAETKALKEVRDYIKYTGERGIDWTDDMKEQAESEARMEAKPSTAMYQRAAGEHRPKHSSDWQYARENIKETTQSVKDTAKQFKPKRVWLTWRGLVRGIRDKLFPVKPQK